MNAYKLGIIIFLFLVDKILQYVQLSPIWFNYYADDLLFLPVALSLALWIQQKYVNQQFKFSIIQIIFTWLACSILFEGIYPALFLDYIQDPLDVLAYGIGAVIFSLFLNQGAVK